MEPNFLQIARPVLFESPESEWPYWGKGSSFLVSFRNNCFFVSAKHVIENLGGAPESLRVFPSDNSRISIPFEYLVTIKLANTEDESYKDLYLLKISTKAFASTTDSDLFTISLENECAHPAKLSLGSKMLLIGFPSEIRGVDYENCRIRYARQPLEGEFRGPSMMPNCFEMHLKDSGGLKELDGFSGCPVFHVNAHNKPCLAGVMIRGTISSGICHFIGVHVLQAVINKTIEADNAEAFWGETKGSAPLLSKIICLSVSSLHEYCV